MYTIYRTAKLKTHSQIIASSLHMTRGIYTPNADPARAKLNKILRGGSDTAADVLALLPELGARNDDGQILRRSNSVLAIEILITTSPEWFENATDPERNEWVKRSVDWLELEYGAENVAHLQIHRDEQTPHLTGYIVPLDPETGTLNARRWIGGRSLLTAQQTAYADAVAPLGLQRGSGVQQPPMKP